MHKAIGMIETYGLIYSYEALDAMVKTAEVEFLDHTLVTGGIVTVTVQGDVGAVSAAVEAGKERVLSMNGQLLSAHVIPRVDEAVHQIIFPEKKEEKAPASKVKAKPKTDITEKKATPKK